MHFHAMTNRSFVRLSLLLAVVVIITVATPVLMAASPHSPEPYFPMLLSNGADAILVDYSGSCLSGLANHAHREQNQGCPTGWYKAGTRGHGYLQPIVQAGYMVSCDSEICDIQDFEQHFDAKKAILHTRVNLRGVVCEIESFLTDDSVLVEHYRVVEVPTDQVEIAFTVDAPSSGIRASRLRHRAKIETKFDEKSGHVSIDYTLGKINGSGAMLTDRKPDGFRRYPYTAMGLLFKNIKPGWSATRFLILSDPTDGEGHEKRFAESNQACQEKGYAGLKQEHVDRWTRYSGQSRIAVPDERFQGIYDLSVYCLRANLHPRTGGITVGLLPPLWGGGVYVPYDAYFTHQALLNSNHLKEAGKHLNYYAIQRDFGRKMAKKNNLPGAAYSGWADCYGLHLRSNFERDVFYHKPLMSGFVAMKHYWQWRYEPTRTKSREELALMREILDLAIARFIDDQGDEAIMKPCMAGNESEIEVENDTFHSVIYARSLGALAEMAEGLGVDIGHSYKQLSDKMYKGLQKNYQDGVLYPFRGAKYLASLQTDFFLFNLPEGIGPRSVYTSLEAAKTPWGQDTTQPSEAYRDWPWLSARASIALSRFGDSKESFRYLKHTCHHASSLGAIPEKIRIDGYAIGYWYPSPHALLVWATNDSFCHDGKDGSIRLLWGLDGQWKNVEFENLRLAGGLLVSGKVRDGQVVSLVVKNEGEKTLQKNLVVNPIYKGLENQEVNLPSHATVKIR